ncbi:DUF3551 domain-containing protein [Bradyrhizobium prioriisuperbiae]|uniref:DUF3551 domain-containing protein n=1 Tax=Bradyrhizobium prioriisuperbiae TaxID=2854389 RepID=UPI0028E52A92|nr:DUF3551 domain-containing protein [Bradyrhizobium prioritasuperba]
MRTALIIAATAGLLASITSAAAQDYPWCRLGNHDCMYSTYGQCMAALSGTVGDCRLNPALQAEPLRAYNAMPRHHQRHRHHHRHHRRG